MQTLLVGDIHACYDELQRLLDASGLADADRIIALGDFVDRGPAVGAVVEFFQTRPNTFSLCGNHERKHIRWSRREVRSALSQQITRKQLDSAYPQALSFFETLPLYMELPEAVLMHGYLEPNVPLAEQKETVLCGSMSGESYLTAHYDRPWYELVELDRPVVFGHRDFYRNGQPFVYQDRFFGLDTSCVLGKRLTGLLLPEFRFVSVPAEKNYWLETRRAHRVPGKPDAKTEKTPAPDVPWEEAEEVVLEALLERVRCMHAEIHAQLTADPAYLALTAREQARQYAALVRGSRAEVLLHLARHGTLTAEKARGILRDPAQARALLDDLSSE